MGRVLPILFNGDMVRAGMKPRGSRPRQKGDVRSA